MAPAITAPPMTPAATPVPTPIRGAATERRHPSQSRSRLVRSSQPRVNSGSPRRSTRTGRTSPSTVGDWAMGRIYEQRGGPESMRWFRSLDGHLRQAR